MRLSRDERDGLQTVIKKLARTSQKVRRAQILLKTDAEFVESMEDVLGTYAAPYDSDYPVLCMDEQPVQLLKETRVPIAAT